jgi:hypothetical protein
MKDYERETFNDTIEHQDAVRMLLRRVIHELTFRMADHDRTKLMEPEFSGFAEVNDQLADVEYDSDEYWELMDQLDDTLEHHYAEYPHHPEHFEDGVDDMTLVDVVEMLCDWAAATQRHDDDGDIFDSIEKNAERFDLCEQLAQILRNTAKVTLTEPTR